MDHHRHTGGHPRPGTQKKLTRSGSGGRKPSRKMKRRRARAKIKMKRALAREMHRQRAMAAPPPKPKKVQAPPEAPQETSPLQVGTRIRVRRRIAGG